MRASASASRAARCRYAQRIPKLPGFKNPFKKIYAVVNVSKLQALRGRQPRSTPTCWSRPGSRGPAWTIKVLGTGDLKRKLTVEAHAFSSSARAAIEARGGSVKVLGEPRKIGARRLAAKTGKGLKVGAPEATPAEEKPARAEKGRSKSAPPRGEVAEPSAAGGDAQETKTEEA